MIRIKDYIFNENEIKWFEKAWEEYRQHVLSSSMDDMKMPGYVFNKYIEGK